jgi:hypothetical protein
MKFDAGILASLPFELQAEISENLCVVRTGRQARSTPFGGAAKPC